MSMPDPRPRSDAAIDRERRTHTLTEVRAASRPTEAGLPASETWVAPPASGGSPLALRAAR